MTKARQIVLVGVAVLSAVMALARVLPGLPDYGERPFFWIVVQFKGERLLPWLPWTGVVWSLINALIAAALAAFVSWRARPTQATRVLIAALCFGALAQSYFFAWRALPPLQTLLSESLIWRAGLDGLAIAVYLSACFLLVRFFDVYPSQVAKAQFLDANFSAVDGSVARSPGLWLSRRISANRWAEGDPPGRELNRRVLDYVHQVLVRGPFPWRLLLLLATVIEGAWLIESTWPAARVLGQTLLLQLPGLLLIFGFFLLKANAIHGAPTDRRAVEWIYWALLWTVGVLFFAFIGALLWVFIGSVEWSLKGFLIITALGPAFALSVLLLALLISMIQRGTVDPALMVRRTAVAGLIGFLLTVSFVALEGVISSQVVVRLGWPSETGAIVSGTAVALLFSPLRQLIERRIDRLVHHLQPLAALADAEPREAAIVFSDLSGYSALTARDQRTALIAVHAFHRVAEQIARQHGGRLIKTIGDAVMMSFEQPDGALSATRRLHADIRAFLAKEQLPALAVHSGLHLGPVIFAEGGDAFGATVNLAARLQGEAADGEMVFSDAFRQALAQAPGEAEDIGARTLKNLPEPVRCWRQVI